MFRLVAQQMGAEQIGFDVRLYYLFLYVGHNKVILKRCRLRTPPEKKWKVVCGIWRSQYVYLREGIFFVIVIVIIV